MEFWLKLFDVSDFPPRWSCGRWTEAHGWLHITSDLAIGAAYFSIPCFLAYFISRRKDLPFRKIFFLFAAFILLCGSTHLMEATIFWWPAYRLAGALKLLTAAVSWGTVFALTSTVPRALQMRSPEELEREIAARRAAEENLERTNAELERRVQEGLVHLTEANAALAAEREWLRVTLSSIGDAVITADTEGRVTTLNRAAERLTGWTEHDAKGVPLQEVFHVVNDKTGAATEGPATLAAASGGLADTLLISRDGVERFIDDSAAPIRSESGETIGVVLTFRDLTRDKAAATALRESDERFAQLADAISQLVWIARPDGAIEWYNQRWYDYTGTTFEQMQGWGWSSVHDPDVLPEVIKQWTGSLETGSPLEMEFPLRGADGRLRPFLTKALPFRDEEGAIVRWFGTNTDISEQKQTQEELRRTAAALSDADRRKDEFLAMLAHELRNPLAPIRSGLQWMKSAEYDPTAFERVRDVMARQTHQLVVLVDDLLDVSRITLGTLKLNRQKASLSEIVQSAVEECQVLIREAQHELHITVPEKPIYFYADSARLTQVLSNLLNNAARYTPPRGTIWLTVQVQNGEVLISVKDTGVGIPADKLETIFGMFNRIGSSQSQDPGLGIGLTLGRRLIEMHGGQIEAQSQGVNQGSSFTIKLPLEESVEAQPDEQQHQTTAARVLRLLIVDDNRAAAEMLAMVLETRGHEIRIGHDGRQAVALAAEFRPDFVLMDLGMPIMNGYEAARHIRRQPWGGGMVLVALSGWNKEEDTRRSKEAGFDSHLVKPVETTELERLLATLRRPPA